MLDKAAWPAYLLCFGSASVMSVSTVWMLSRISESSISDVNCLLVSEYKNSTRRGAKAWIYGVATLRSG